MPVNRAATGGDPVITIRGATIGYGGRATVNDVDLRIDRGEVVALIGPNGSGKTTLVRGILHLAQVTSGSVELFGVPAPQFHERWRIGYVPQRHTVVGAVPSTVEEVVGSGRLARRGLLSRTTAADRAVVAEALDTVGLADRAKASVATLSGGQQRRVLIARALASRPEVLVMDEPTAGVDAQSQERLVATLGRLVEQGLTLLIVTHEIAPLAAILTRVVELQDGRITRDLPAAMATGSDRPVGHDPGHDPHHAAAGAHGAPDDPIRSPAPGWLHGPGTRG
jgi:zinc transport system ATP-binding protein